MINKKVFNLKMRQKGFTLIEILLVMLITSVLVLGVNTAFRQTHMLWSRVEKQKVVYQKSRLLLDTIRAELTCLYMPKVDDEQQLTPFSLSLLPDSTIRLSFITLNPSWENTAVSNLPAKISYEFTADSDSGQKILSRTEQLFSGEKAICSERKKTLFKGLSGFNIQAANPDSDTTDWKDNLQCRQTSPKAIKVQLKWPREGQTDFEFNTIIKIVCNGQLTP